MTPQWTPLAAPWYVDAGGSDGVVQAWLSFDWSSGRELEYMLTVPLRDCLVWVEFDQVLMEREDRLDVLSARVQQILAEGFDPRWGIT
ncbi:MAG: hypothetical protein JWR63_1999 [Conexibacter sp.]|nr:hypothetical protein [Conexibacter sp.]